MELQLAERIRAALPHIPRLIARRIAAYYVSNGRCLMTADPINLASAWIRHRMTEYDTLFGKGYPKAAARAYVQPQIAATLQAWR